VDASDTASPEVAAAVYLPFCTLPRSTFAVPTPQASSQVAQDEGFTGSNNWSGGYCGATLRNQFDVRFTVTDGFNYSPVTPLWASGGQGGTVSNDAGTNGGTGGGGEDAAASPGGGDGEGSGFPPSNAGNNIPFSSSSTVSIFSRLTNTKFGVSVSFFLVCILV